MILTTLIWLTTNLKIWSDTFPLHYSSDITFSNLCKNSVSVDIIIFSNLCTNSVDIDKYLTPSSRSWKKFMCCSDFFGSSGSSLSGRLFRALSLRKSVLASDSYNSQQIWCCVIKGHTEKSGIVLDNQTRRILQEQNEFGALS